MTTKDRDRKKEKKERKEKEKREKRERKGKKSKAIFEMPVLSEFEIGGTVYKTTFPTNFRQKKWKPKDIGEIEALITGTVKNIFVKKGDPVKEGDCLLLLEAMKMNNEILSPVDGVVQDIFVTENSNVSKGTQMIKITSETVSEN
jgi:biotin carboxyl carrier protein